MSKLPLEDQIIPRLYRKKEIAKEEAMKLMRGKTGMKNNVAGLVYRKTQMPRKKSNNNGWKHVLRQPSVRMLKQESLYNIQLGKRGSIHVQFLRKPPGDSIKNGFEHFYKSYNKVRDEKEFGESGNMVPIGKRFCRRGSCVSSFSKKPSASDVNSEESTKNTQCLADLHHYINDSSKHFSSLLQRELSSLKECDNVMKLKSHNNLIVMPTYVVSKNLTNAIHQDVGDGSRTFAIWYQEKEGTGLGYFAFPEYSLAIQLAGPTLVSWMGAEVKHCSTTIWDGIVSPCPFSKRNVTQRKKSNYAFEKRCKNSMKVSSGDIVEVQQRLKKRSHDLKFNDQYYKSRQYSTRQAEVVEVLEYPNVCIRYKSKVDKGKDVVVSLFDITKQSVVGNNKNC